MKIWAARLSEPFTKTSGANGSARANPLNSRWSSLRWVLLPTTPLTMTSTPISSAWSRRLVNASVQSAPRRSTENDKALVILGAASSGGVVVLKGTDPIRLRQPCAPHKVPVPVLALLALVDRVEEVAARTDDTPVPYRAQVRDRDLLIGGFGQEEVADRGACRLRELFDLLQRGDPIASYPVPQLREPPGESIRIKARTLEGPHVQRRFDLDSDSHVSDPAIRFVFGSLDSSRITILGQTRPPKPSQSM